MTEIRQIVNTKLELASSPHVHTKMSSERAMQMVILALLPSTLSAVIYFGLYQLLIFLVSIAVAMGTEYAIKKIRKQANTLYDGSAFLTGLLLALILPPNFSLVFTGLGAFISIALGKEIFGGIGYNIFNPALVGRAFLQAAFPVPMTTWTKTNFNVDAVTSATPLGGYKFDGVAADLSQMFIGNTSGSLGETSALAILLGGIFLIAVGIVNWRIPVSMILALLVFGGILWLAATETYINPIYHLIGGGFLFGAFFMATDWVSSPITAKGMWIFGIGISLIIILIRVFGGIPEGVMYAILFMNAWVPLINRYTQPTIFGAKK